MGRLINWKIDKKKIMMGLECVKNNSCIYESDYLGCVDIGELSVDFILRDSDEGMILEYDVFVGGVDAGYGQTLKGLPYDYADGGFIVNQKNINEYTLENFKELALKTIEDYIEKSNYCVNGITLKRKADSKKMFNWQ